MASGNTLYSWTGSPPTNEATTNYATFTTISAGTGILPAYNFGTGTDPVLIFSFVVPSYYGDGGFVIIPHYSTDGTSVGEIEFVLSMETISDNDNLGGGSFGTATNLTDTPATATADYVNITAGGTISHANAGSPATGDVVRIQIVRDVDHDTSANTDDLRISACEVQEA